ncbi:Linear gramicidin synthase subunit D [Choanephora cucurbitarum]|uniref:Linear gramicidin synthase subunit D n=1 Tax=Choanephora cucurbitarum TaxID=101091 RepID=A0A1C7NMP6_9FUNG|nr:Linear gramicidin synthase subunit D [Choanephora cucurbitarum]
MASTTPQTIDFASGPALSNHFKAFTNLLSHQCKIYSDNVFARYISKDKVYKTLTYAQVDLLATNLACRWYQYAKTTEVIAYISEHNINYLIVMMALLKLRRTMMAISPRNSEAAITNLMQKTQAKFMIADAKYGSISRDAINQLDNVKLVVVEPFDIELLLQEPLNPDQKNLIDTQFSDADINKDALIIHSSGTTSFPKPIYLSNRYLFHLLTPLHLTLPFAKGVEPLCSSDVMLSCGPLFHIFGTYAHFSMATVGGSVVFMRNLPASLEDIDYALRSNNVTAMCAPPLIFEQMIPYLKKTQDFDAIKRLKFAMFGGAALREASGDWLCEQGLNLCTMYGTTEINAIMTSDLSPQRKHHWSSFRMIDPNTRCVFEDEGELMHLFMPADGLTLATNVSNRPDGSGYNTNDLFKPVGDGYYTYVGRRDDTLVMENGEKTNPLPMETTLRACDLIKQAAVLGQARQCTAALIELDPEVVSDMRSEDVMAQVQDAVKKVNTQCPNHSKIIPQMVKVLPLGQSLPSTDKCTIKRKAVEDMYREEIEALYKAFLEGPAHTTAKSWTADELAGFLEQCAAEILDIADRSQLKDHSQSLFDLGLNSLTSIQLRNRIAEYMDVPQNFLFQHPSIQSIQKALLSHEKQDASLQREQQYQAAQKLAEDYIRMASHDFPKAERRSTLAPGDHVVLLTGVTGSLGSFLLRDLLQDTRVKKVYCCVRGQQDQLSKRLFEAFQSRSLDTTLLQTDRVEVLPMQFSAPYLGFGKELYDRLREEVTIIQHCAWLLDFNMPVDHYDKQCIAPFYQLLKFAYRPENPMQVHFISSVSASAGMDKDEIEEKPLPFDSHTCMPMGYAHSKFVVEKLFDYLASEKNLPYFIERLGQVCGDSENGVWNTSEQYPLMFIGGGSLMHKMPQLDTVIDWISVDYASASIKDLMLQDSTHSIYHIVNPHRIHWSDVLQAMKEAGMSFDIVSTAEWIEALNQDQSNPCYRLISFYEANFKNSHFKMPIWKTEETQMLAPVIDRSPVLDAQLFRKYLTHWQSVGFYHPN